MARSRDRRQNGGWGPSALPTAILVTGGSASMIQPYRCGMPSRAYVAAVDSLGKTLVVFGLVIALVGAVLWIFGRSGGALLPGDIVVERKNVRFYFPIVTCLVISVVLSLVAWLMRR